MTRQIREQLDNLIEAGTLAAGSLLPSERELANTLKVARNVVRGAYEQLMDAGKLRSEGRRGRSVKSGSGGGTEKSPLANPIKKRGKNKNGQNPKAISLSQTQVSRVPPGVIPWNRG